MSMPWKLLSLLFSVWYLSLTMDELWLLINFHSLTLPRLPPWMVHVCRQYHPCHRVNYVVLSPMASTSDDLDLVVDMVISSIGLLECDLFTPVTTLDMVSFQSVFLPSNEDLLEAMTEFCPLTWCHSGALSSWNPWSRGYKDSFFISKATSLKNETEVFEHDFLISSSLKNETGLEHSFLISSSLKNETTWG